MTDGRDSPLEFEGTTGSLVEFAMASLLSPALLVDGGGTVESASPAALADLRLAPDEIQGRSVDEVLGTRADELAERCSRATATHAASTQVDGRERSLHFRATSLAGARVDGGWLIEFRLDGTATDASLSERSARLDDLLDDLSDRFERLNRYVSLISHDLQAPTRRLLSFVELTRGDLEDGKPIDGDLDAIERSARYLLRLTTELLQFSRLGHQPMTLEPVDADDVLAATIEQLDELINRAGATVSIQPELPTVEASPTFLGVVFQHLIQNAIRYRREADPQLEIRWSVDGDTVRIEFSDNGTGIAPEHHKAVFQPFRRLVAGDLEHTGLGLATVHDLMERFGGSIVVAESAPGVGTTFALTMSLAEAATSSDTRPDYGAGYPDLR